MNDRFYSCLGLNTPQLAAIGKATPIFVLFKNRYWGGGYFLQFLVGKKLIADGRYLQWLRASIGLFYPHCADPLLAQFQSCNAKF